MQSAQGRGRRSGEDACFLHCDVTDMASVETAIAETVARYGKLNVLHNYAGGATPADGPVTEAPVEEFWRAMKLDVFGTFLCSKIAIPHIAAAGGGSIINMSSIVALMALPGRDCYSDFGAYALDGRRVRTAKIWVNAIAPSVTLSDHL